MLTTPAPSSSRGSDSYFWEIGNYSSHHFSTKKTWNHFRPTEGKKDWAKIVWFKQSVPKHAFTFWIANLNRLPVRTRLLSWGIQVSSECPLCNSEAESRDHLLLHCSFSLEVWNSIMIRLGHHPRIFANWSALITWLLTKSPNRSTTLKRLVIQATVFLLWKERNIRVHDHIFASHSTVVSQIDRSIRDTLLARRYRKGCGRLLSQWFAHI